MSSKMRSNSRGGGSVGKNQSKYRDDSDDDKELESPDPNYRPAKRTSFSNSSDKSAVAKPVVGYETASVSRLKPRYSGSESSRSHSHHVKKGVEYKDNASIAAAAVTGQLSATVTATKTVDFDDDRSEAMQTVDGNYNKELGKCTRCQEPVTRHQEHIRVAGMIFHKDHFTCSGLCSSLLNIDDNVYVVDGTHVFCEEDYQGLFENLCYVCGKQLDGQGVVLPKSLNDPRKLTKATTIHLECATCEVCGTGYSTENALGIVKGTSTVIMCHKCYVLAQKKLSNPKCETCGRAPWVCKCKEDELEEEKAMEMWILMWFASTEDFVEARRTGKVVASNARGGKSMSDDPVKDIGKINLGANSFVKHGRRGNPKSRLVTVDLKRGEIDWGNHRVNMEDVVAIVKGKHTKVFKRKVSEAAKAKNCFSIVLKNRTLDLEARNNKQRESWFEGLQKMIVWYIEKKHEGAIAVWQLDAQ
jgi:hypothetical protein